MVNPTIELGTFLVFLIIPVIALLITKALSSWGWPGKLIGGSVGVLGFIMLGATALYMFSDYDIVVTKVIAESQTSQLAYNTTGGIVSNSTTITPEHTEINPIINENQYIFGWLFFGFAFMYGLLVVKVIWYQ